MAVPTTIGVKEVSGLGPGGQLVKNLQITYKVGALGPFTLITTPVDLQSGVAAQQMQSFANSVTALPGATQS